MRTLVENPGLCRADHSLPGARHRRQQHDLQRRRHGRHPAAAVSRPRRAGRRSTRPTRSTASSGAASRTSICRTGRSAPARLRGDGRRHRPQPDAVRRRRAGAVLRRDGHLEHVSDARHPADSRPPVPRRRRHARRPAASCSSATASGSAATPATPSVIGRIDYGQRQPAHRRRRDAAEVSVSRSGRSSGSRRRRSSTPARARRTQPRRASRGSSPGASFDEARRDIGIGRPTRSPSEDRDESGLGRDGERRCATSWCPRTSASS